LAPLITNKKHKEIKIKEKIAEFSNQLFKTFKKVYKKKKKKKKTNKIKKTIMKVSLIFGLTFIFKSSIKPRRKNNAQNDRCSKKETFLNNKR
jgi:hypothetical protein